MDINWKRFNSAAQFYMSMHKTDRFIHPQFSMIAVEHSIDFSRGNKHSKENM